MKLGGATVEWRSEKERREGLKRRHPLTDNVKLNTPPQQIAEKRRRQQLTCNRLNSQLNRWLGSQRHQTGSEPSASDLARTFLIISTICNFKWRYSTTMLLLNTIVPFYNQLISDRARAHFYPSPSLSRRWQYFLPLSQTCDYHYHFPFLNQIDK